MKFSIDLTHLNRGDSLTSLQCELILNCNQGSIEFSQKQMYLCKWIEDELWKIGKEITVIIKDGEIKLLTHPEAAKYAESTFESGKRKIRLSHRRACAVDLGCLTEEMRREHLQLIGKMGFTISCMRKRVIPDVEPTVRSTPARR